MDNIPLTRFSGTLLDFILVSRQLGLRYVWIDALCIIQKDEEDFAKESVLMHKVYGHAILTISVCSNKSARESFLITREIETLPPEKCGFAGRFLSVKAKTLEEVRESSPLMKRAWTFQEEFLSPRVLYWSDHGVFWNCVLKQYAERDALKGRDPLSRGTSWDRTIEAYTPRQLSHPEDRLTALAGVASKFAVANDEYLAGLWKSSLPGSLLWIVQGIPERRTNTEVAAQYIAPSWSCKFCLTRCLKLILHICELMPFKGPQYLLELPSIFRKPSQILQIVNLKTTKSH
jgi:hypothetical protein